MLLGKHSPRGTIRTVVNDIERVLLEGITPTEEQLSRFSTNLSKSIAESLSQRERKSTLRMSNIGRPCERQLWYEINLSETSEALRPETYMKFMYGHLIEELVLFLAELAGHEVTGRQDEAEIAGVKGHRDAIVSGTLVDVKSASSYSFKKFASGSLQTDDPFGYIPQLQSYLHDAQKDSKVTNKDSAGFLVVDKTLGHITYDEHLRDTETDWPKLYEQKIAMVSQVEPPERGYTLVPYGSSGNMALPMACSYCPFKKTCYPELRTFLYANRPVDLAVVVKTPLVPELGVTNATDTTRA